MASLPRIITVDPIGSIPQQIRAAFDLMDRLVVQIDVPGPQEALEELERGGIDTVVAAWNLGNGTQGWELAAKLRQIDENVNIMLMGDYSDTELDEEMREQSPFVYLKRPFDIPQLINVLKASVDGGDIFAAANEVPQATSQVDLGPVPAVQSDKLGEVMKGITYDLKPIAALVTTRNGDIVASHTDMSDLDHDYLSNLIGSTAEMNINMRDVIGGNLQTLQLYDGSDFDVFVLSVGLHHFLVLVYDGKDGAAQIGVVRRYGSKHAEDLIAIIGPAAFLVQRREVEPEPDTIIRKSDRTKRATQEVEGIQLEKAELGSGADESEAPVKSSMPVLDAIDDSDFDADLLFGEDFALDDADDLFSLEALEDLDLNEEKKGTTDWSGAVQLGLMEDE